MTNEETTSERLSESGKVILLVGGKAEPWLETTSAYVFSSHSYTALLLNQTPRGWGSVSCILTSPPGYSRTAALADLAPNWLKTPKSTDIWRKQIHSLPLLLLPVLSAGSGHR